MVAPLRKLGQDHKNLLPAGKDPRLFSHDLLLDGEGRLLVRDNLLLVGDDLRPSHRFFLLVGDDAVHDRNELCQVRHDAFHLRNDIVEGFVDLLLPNGVHVRDDLVVRDENLVVLRHLLLVRVQAAPKSGVFRKLVDLEAFDPWVGSAFRLNGVAPEKLRCF